MGYTTTFTGRVTVEPPLNQQEIGYLREFARTRHDKGEFPGIWCDWVPTDDGRAIEWNRTEKFYNAAEWMRYLIDHFLKQGGHAQGQAGFEEFTFDHVLNGTIDADGEDSWDVWQLLVRDNLVSESMPEVADPVWMCEDCKQLVADEDAVCCPGSELMPLYPE